MRCDVYGVSGHVTIKLSICKRCTFYKSSVYVVNVSCLTPGDLPRCSGVMELSAE